MAAAGRRGLLIWSQWSLASIYRAPQPRAGAQIFAKRMYAAWEESVEVDQDVSPTRQLRQALKEVRLQKAAPAWLPLVPGSSFWVPPEEYEEEDSETDDDDDSDAHVVTWPETNFRPTNNSELYSLMTPMGWPAMELMSGDEGSSDNESSDDSV
eukprot:TRINITY_DN13054_c0_g1_i1.p1 TRINITY_DN13054_c0_g1~~TRINITY_DN13054_c0_g1_i1.p1  ORF type:complete len:171 (+),score=18.58 TRINITY_DN13054_c0_g1_i1:53-514(+)